MAKFSFKRPRIISKKFSGMSSSIDSVTKSLNDLVFLYTDKADKSLQKKHVMMGVSSIILLLVLGSFISPKGKAESSVFYPENCLGGWINPQYAEGEQQTTSNGDETQFTKNNSAVLPKNTNAEMYCGNFRGKFDQATKPTKIIVSLALTKGNDLALEDTIESGIVGSSSLEVSSSSLATTTLDTLILASSTAATAEETATSTATDTIPTITGVQPSPIQDTTSAIGDLFNSVKESIDTLLENNKNPSSQTDTVVVPPSAPMEDQPQPTPEDQLPTSYYPLKPEKIFSLLFQRVFAQEDGVIQQEPTVPAQEEVLAPQNQSELPIENLTENEEVQASQNQPETPIENLKEDNDQQVVSTSSTSTPPLPVIHSLDVSVLDDATTTSTSTTETGSTTEIITSTTLQEVATTTDENQFQNNFLEVLYTFDGVNWISLGELNEISMKYRTFEIPVTASTSWGDMSHLQIKIIAMRHEKDTPTVYLDGIKVEVLYETELSRSHPDFARDTILKDEIIDGIRIVTIINSENSLHEIWYMYLDDAASTEGTSSVTTSTSTEEDIVFATSTASTTVTTIDEHATTTGSTTPVVVNLLKRTWKKYLGTDLGVGTSVLIEAIKKQELIEQLDQEDRLPNFASDTIKRMKGTFTNSVIVQIERTIQDILKDELWLYDLTKDQEERIGEASSTTISPDSPLGLKDNHLFWISVDKTLVYGYDLTTKKVMMELLPTFNSSEGERAEVRFDDFPWKVILSSDGFSFYSDETGEVFSDENSQAVEMLRQKALLDSLLDKEQLSNLNLPVEVGTSTNSLDTTSH